MGEERLQSGPLGDFFGNSESYGKDRDVTIGAIAYLLGKTSPFEQNRNLSIFYHFLSTEQKSYVENKIPSILV